MSEYPNNSNRNREEKKEKKVEKVVTKGSVKTKKQSELKKIAGNIISEEAKSIKDYAIYDVVIPVIKDTITQLIKGSIDMLFYGEVRSSRGSYYRGNNATRVSYRDYYALRRDNAFRFSARNNLGNDDGVPQARSSGHKGPSTSQHAG